MTTTHDSPMHEIIAGLQIGEDTACYEFVRRQGADELPGLAAGGRALGDAALTLIMSEPARLSAWEYPETPDALPAETLQAVVDAAAAGAGADALKDQLAGLAFGQWVTANSLAGRLHQYAERARRAPLVAAKRADPQLALWPGESDHE